MATIPEMREILKSMGVFKRFKPYHEPDDDTILLETKKKNQIIDGIMVGVEIDVYDSDTIRVWTPQTKKARRISKENSLRIKEMDGESELYVPAHLADALLPCLGAKIKRIAPPGNTDRLSRTDSKIT